MKAIINPLAGKNFKSRAVSYAQSSNAEIIGAGLGGLALGGIAGYGISKLSRKKSSKKKRSYSRKYKKQRVKSGSRGKRRRYTPHTAGKRKDRSHRRIRHTKNGQPYIILESGKARFISKKSARNSRKRSGGRY